MPLVVHCWEDLQSVHGLRCYGNMTRTRNVSEYMFVLALCLVGFCEQSASCIILSQCSGIQNVCESHQWQHSIGYTAMNIGCHLANVSKLTYLCYGLTYCTV